MHKKLLVPVLLLSLLSLVLAPVGAQQDDRSRWNLTERFNVTDLGFYFLFPEGWVWSAENGILIAENGDDLNAAIDENDNTFPKGVVIQLVARQLADLGFDPTTASLDEVVEGLIGSAGMTIEEQFDVPVLTHRGVSVYGTFPDGSSGLATLWLQGTQVIIFEYYGPNADQVFDHAFSWGQLLSTVAPVEPLPLITEPHFIPNDNMNIQYPEGWVIENEGLPFTVADTPTGGTGYGMFTVRGDAAEFVGTAAPSLEETVERVQEFLNVEETLARREHLLFEQPAVMLYGTSQEGTWAEALITLIGEDVFIIVRGAPSEEALLEFRPTWMAVLQSLELLDETTAP